MNVNPGETLLLNFYVKNITPTLATDLIVGGSLLRMDDTLVADSEWCKLYGTVPSGEGRWGVLQLTVPADISPTQEDYRVVLSAWKDYTRGFEIEERVVGSGAERAVWFIYAPSTGSLTNKLDSIDDTIFVEEEIITPEIDAQITMFSISKA